MARKILPTEEIARVVYEDVRWAREYRKEKSEDWLRFYALYRNYIDQAEYPYDSNLGIPTAYMTIEVQVSYIMDMIMSGGDFVEVLGKTPEGQMSARAVREMLNYHFRHSFNTWEEMAFFVRQLLLFGTSPFKTFWLYQPAWRTRKTPKLNEAGEVVGEEDVDVAEIAENKPSGYTVDLFNFGIDPHAPSLERARYAFEEMFVDPMEVIERQQAGLYDAKVDVSASTFEGQDQGLVERYNQVGLTGMQFSPQEMRNRLHLIDWWGYLSRGVTEGKWKKGAKRQLYHVILLVSGATQSGEGVPQVLLAEPSPYRHQKLPFSVARLNVLPGEFYGVGDIEINESLLVEQRDLRNIQLDNLNRYINKMFLARRGAQIDKAQLKWRPSGVVEVGNLEGDVKTLETPPVDPAVFKAQEEIRRDLQSSTGVNDFTTGDYRSATGFNDTATGISLIQGVAMKRMVHKGQIVQLSIKDIAEKTFAMVAQFQRFGTTVRILDRKSALTYRFIDISETALKNSYDFNIVSAPAVGSKPLRQNQLLQLFQILGNLASGNPNAINFNIPNFVRRLIDEFDIPNPNEFIGGDDYNVPLADTGEPKGGLLLDPEEENRLMIEQHQNIAPKLEEHHAYHMQIHSMAYNQVTGDQMARMLLRQHYLDHQKMAEQSRKLLAEAMLLNTQVASMRQAQQQLAQQQNMVSPKGAKGPTGAGGQENAIRAIGNVAAGNVSS